jgi:hypothetical protein
MGIKQNRKSEALQLRKGLATNFLDSRSENLGDLPRLVAIEELLQIAIALL